MNSKLLLFVLTALVTFSSCSKDNSTTSGQTKLHRIYAEGQLQSEYTYGPDGLLIKHVLYGLPGKKISENNYSYDINGRLLKMETSMDLSSSYSGSAWSYGYTEYNYNMAGRISEEKNYLQTNNTYELRSRIKSVYDINGRLISRAMSLPDDTPIMLTTYQYNSKGNIVFQEEYRYNNTALERQFSYSYDDYDNKKNPYRGISGLVLPFTVNQNNIQQMTVTNYIVTPGTPVVTINKTEYKSYNSEGLPVHVFQNGTNFRYEYQ